MELNKKLFGVAGVFVCLIGSYFYFSSSPKDFGVEDSNLLIKESTEEHLEVSFKEKLTNSKGNLEASELIDEKALAEDYQSSNQELSLLLVAYNDVLDDLEQRKAIEDSFKAKLESHNKTVIQLVKAENMKVTQ